MNVARERQGVRIKDHRFALQDTEGFWVDE
jgi:hypothetical protein